jgi:lipoate-protein ligase A
VADVRKGLSGMSGPSQLRLIIDPEANSGEWNMAVDESLLQSAIERDVATFRWYRWREPTVSLGYFQSKDEFTHQARFSSLPCVRRLTGGGALVHDHELTYSLSLPASQRWYERPMELYRVVHGAFISILAQRGVLVRYRGVTQKDGAGTFLCFSRQDENDLVLGEHKVLGSAQRRRRGAILQHGGLLLQASTWTPELPGLIDLADRINLHGFEQDVSQVVSKLYSVEAVLDVLSSTEREFATSRASS